jgi:hypothetical protein
VAINVGLDFALIPAVGIWGPAVATAAQSLLSRVVVLGTLPGRRAFLRAGAAALPVALAVGGLAAAPEEPVLLVAAGAVAALAAAWAARVLRGRPAPLLSAA